MAVVENPLFAWLFARLGARNEARGQAALRRELLEGLDGDVVEVGPGTGLNFAHYPAGTGHVTAVEPEPTLRVMATEAARAATVPIDVVGGTAESLPLPAASADALVVSGVLCSVPDPAAALAEFRRVLRPGGELRFYEHVRSQGRARGRVQDLADVVWPRLMGGCHTNRDTLTAIADSGFRLERWRELIFPEGSKVSVVAPRILGRARPVP